MRGSPKILLVDDEADITANIAPILERSGFEVVVANDGEQARELVQKESPKLIVLDVLMPYLNGRELLRQLRHAGNWTPVILLTQVGEAVERAMALEEGADDYINKPFDPFELVARIKAVLRRTKPGQQPLATAQELHCQSLIFNRSSRRIQFQGQVVTLTAKATALLEYFMTHPEEVLSRERLLDAVWDWAYPAGTRTVDARIAEIRRVLGDDPKNPRFIATMPGQGYCFVGSVETGP
jgi:DNA-binding response OmpR family regulator